MRKLNTRQVMREKSLFRYSSALDRGDFAGVAAVLNEAERDPLLAKMITEINAAYESEYLHVSRLGSSLNHSTNHREKDLIMTTITLPDPRRSSQRWLPMTLVAACVSVLFLGAMLMRPTPTGGLQAGIQVQSSATPTIAASATPVPTATFTATPSMFSEASVLSRTIIPPADGLPIVSAVGTPVCGGAKVMTADSTVHVRPSNHSTAVWKIQAGTLLETLATGFAAEDDTSVPQSQWFFIKADVDGNSVQGWVSANLTQAVDPANPCPANEVITDSGVAVLTIMPGNAAIQVVEVTPINSMSLTTASPAFSVGVVPVTIVPAGVIAAAPALAATPTAYFDSVMRTNPPVIMINRPIGSLSANSRVEITMAGFDGTQWTYQLRGANGETVTLSQGQLLEITASFSAQPAQTGLCHVYNRNDKGVPIFAAPLNINSNSAVIGELPPASDAVVLYQQYTQDSSPISNLWYLILMNEGTTTQVSGWIQAQSVIALDVCPAPQ